jgi:hypothetical protein
MLRERRPNAVALAGPGYQARRRLVVYRMRPATTLGRALGVPAGVLLLIAALFVSLVIFSIAMMSP